MFCGSAADGRPEYVAAARDLAAELTRRGLGLVYGGGSVGLMGALADAALATGVEVIGVIPRPLASRELAHAARESFIRPEHLALLVVADTPSHLLDHLASWNPPSLPRAWLSPSQS